MSGAALLLQALLLTSPEGPAASAGKLEFQPVFAPRDVTSEGSGYTAIAAGPDGRVFAGTAFYGGYAWLLELDPAARALKKVASVREVTGEALRGIHTQGKIHAKMSIASDGKVYFATKQGHEVFDTRPEFEDAAGYPGGHLCVYDPSTGITRDLGIPLAREGLLWALLDEPRRRVYLKSEPRNHFLYFQLDTGTVADRGNVGAACRYAVLDPRGVVYTVGRGRTLARFDPDQDFLEELEVEVEGEGGYRSPYVLAIAPDGRRLYGLTAGHPHVIEFDIERTGPVVKARNAAPVIGGGLPNLDIHAAAFGTDGRLYFPVLSRMGQTLGEVIHLMRFDPKARDIADLGIPTPRGHDDAAHRHLYVKEGPYRLDHIQGAAVGPDGTLYLLDIYPQLNVAVFPRLTAPHH